MKPSFSQYRTHIAHLRDAALKAADPAAAVLRSLGPDDLSCEGRIFVVGAGKAGAAMTKAVEGLLGDRIAAGIVSMPNLPAQGARRVELLEGGHPVPTPGSLLAGEKIITLLQTTTENDLVIVLLSGGGSALMEAPQPGLTLEHIQATTDLLLKSGADIREINCLRTPLSRIKGGGLARAAFPARVLGLVLSDVVGNLLETIASGPTLLRRYSAEEIRSVLDKYQLHDTLPLPVLDRLNRYPVDPADPHDAAARVVNRIIASNRLAGEAAAAAAHKLGFRMASLSDDLQGSARTAGKRFAEQLIRESGRGPACCIIGGETTVAIHGGGGKGGRNQEAALSAAIVLDGEPNIALAMLATDGVDGPTDAAGAVVTGKTIERARRMGMDPLHHLGEHNSYPFFSALDDLLITGPTGTNVNDLFFGLVY
jgi:glycerate 2-kinase